MREEETFTFGQLAPIFGNAAHCASNVVMPVGVGQEHEDLIRAVLRNNVAAPQRLMHTLHKLFARVLNGKGFIVTRPLERDKHNANRAAPVGACG